MSPAPAAGVPGSGVVTLRLPFAAASAAVVRRELQDWMGGHGATPDLVEDARLVVTELVGNAVRHADPIDPGQLLVSWHEECGQLALSVTDGGGRTLPEQRLAPLDAQGGRGLTIVDALVQRWWVERERTRNTVHALLPLGALVPAS